MVYRYKKYFNTAQNHGEDARSNIPHVLLSNKKVFLHSGKGVTLFKIRREIAGCKFGELLFTRKYRPAKYRKSKKKK